CVLNLFKEHSTEALFVEEAAAKVSLKGHAVLYCRRIMGEVFKRVTYALVDNKNGLELLLDDVREDTCETVSRNWVKESDLIYLKSLLKEHRKEIFPEYKDWPSDEAYLSLDSLSDYSTSDDSPYASCPQSPTEQLDESSVPD
ncbi:hypothetical protein MPER_07471, partial [Moniliophthora perniciosa FA553]